MMYENRERIEDLEDEVRRLAIAVEELEQCGGRKGIGIFNPKWEETISPEDVDMKTRSTLSRRKYINEDNTHAPSRSANRTRELKNAGQTYGIYDGIVNVDSKTSDRDSIERSLASSFDEISLASTQKSPSDTAEHQCNFRHPSTSTEQIQENNQQHTDPNASPRSGQLMSNPCPVVYKTPTIPLSETSSDPTISPPQSTAMPTLHDPSGIWSLTPILSAHTPPQKGPSPSKIGQPTLDMFRISLPSGLNHRVQGGSVLRTTPL